MFIPDLLIDLKPHKNNIGGGEETQIPAIAQCIILYHLEVKSLEGKGTYDIADLFNVSYANVNRAVRWLKDKEVIALSGGKTKSMIFQFKSVNYGTGCCRSWRTPSSGLYIPIVCLMKYFVLVE